MRENASTRRPAVSATFTGDDPPLRVELFSREQMAQHGTARRHLPPGYSRNLPRRADGPSATLPRVYDIALETISRA